MRLAFVTPAPPLRGGPVQYAAQLYARLGARGHTVTVLGYRRQYPAILFPGRNQLDDTPLHLPNEPLFDPVNPLSWRRTAQRVGELAPDVLLLQYWMPFFAPGYGAIGWLSRRWSRARIILLAHNITPHERQPGGRLLTRWLVAQCDAFIVHSTTVRDDLLALKPNARYVQVPHPVHQMFECSLTQAQARARLGLAADAPVLLHFGYVRAYKGLHVLLDTMPRVRDALPSACLIVAGEFYVDRRPYEQQIAARGLADCVTLVDRFIPREEVGLYFVAADLVVLPYLRATQSGIVPIAAYHARPVIVTAVGGLPEQVVDGETGYIVPPNDAAALAQAITRFFAEKPGFSQKVGFCTWDRLVDAIESLL